MALMLLHTGAKFSKKISLSTTEVLPVYEIQEGRRPPSWIC